MRREEPMEFLAGDRSLVSFNGPRGGDPSNFHPPDQGNLTIGEIPINIAQCEMPNSTSIDRKPGQCFSKT